MNEQPETMEHKPARQDRDFGRVRGTVVKLVIASLLVGFVMHWFGWTPIGILHSLTQNFEELFTSLVDVVTWAIEFILLGATIVVPIWIVVRLMSRGGNRS